MLLEERLGFRVARNVVEYIDVSYDGHGERVVEVRAVQPVIRDRDRAMWDELTWLDGKVSSLEADKKRLKDEVLQLRSQVEKNESYALEQKRSGSPAGVEAHSARDAFGTPKAGE